MKWMVCPRKKVCNTNLYCIITGPRGGDIKLSCELKNYESAGKRHGDHSQTKILHEL